MSKSHMDHSKRLIELSSELSNIASDFSEPFATDILGITFKLRQTSYDIKVSVINQLNDIIKEVSK